MSPTAAVVESGEKVKPDWPTLMSWDAAMAEAAKARLDRSGVRVSMIQEVILKPDVESAWE